jgi:hypothetical protein
MCQILGKVKLVRLVRLDSQEGAKNIDFADLTY